MADGSAAALKVAGAPEDGSLRTEHRTFLSYLITPAVLVVALIALYIYVSNQEIDTIAARSLNAGFLTETVLEHLALTSVSTFLVILIAIPVGVALTRDWTRSFRGVVLNIFNIGQATPTIGLLVLMAVLFLFLGFWSAIIALVAYAILPVVRNTIVGLEGVDANILEAGSGMGLSKGQVLRQIELPLAVPVILAGVRTALVINVGTATLAAFIDGGGLGRVILAGFATNRFPVTLTGAVLTAVLALLIDYLAGVAEDILRPRGL